MKRAVGILALLVLLTFAGILITRLRATPSPVTQSGAQALAVMTAEKTPASPFFESPLPTPSPTALALAPTATAAPEPTASPVPLPTEPPVSPLPSPTATPAPGEWREFTDPEAGYSINFPANAAISAGKSKGEKYQGVLVTFRLENLDRFKYEGMALRVQPNTEGMPVEQIIENLYKDMTGIEFPDDIASTSPIEQTTIAGLPAFQTDIMPDSTSVYIFIPYHDKVYIFALVHALTSNTSDHQAVELFYEILDSFKLLEAP